MCMSWDLPFISIHINLIIPEQPVGPCCQLMMLRTCLMSLGWRQWMCEKQNRSRRGFNYWWALQAASAGTHIVQGQVCLKVSKSIHCGGQNLKPTLHKAWLENVLLSFRQMWGAVSQGVVGRSILLLTTFPTLTLTLWWLCRMHGSVRKVRIQALWWPVRDTGVEELVFLQEGSWSSWGLHSASPGGVRERVTAVSPPPIHIKSSHGAWVKIC